MWLFDKYAALGRYSEMVGAKMLLLRGKIVWRKYWMEQFLIKCTVRARARRRNWQLQRNRNLQETSPISNMQLVSILAGAH
jgi:hypothetical protein